MAAPTRAPPPATPATASPAKQNGTAALNSAVKATNGAVLPPPVVKPATASVGVSVTTHTAPVGTNPAGRAAAKAPAPAPALTPSAAPAKPATSKTVAKGKGKMVDSAHHAAGCTSCKQHLHAAQDGHAEHSSYVAPDCVLNKGGKMLEAGKTCKCKTVKSEAEKSAEVVVHRIFYKRCVGLSSTSMSG